MGGNEINSRGQRKYSHTATFRHIKNKSSTLLRNSKAEDYKESQ